MNRVRKLKLYIHGNLINDLNWFFFSLLTLSITFQRFNLIQYFIPNCFIIIHFLCIRIFPSISPSSHKQKLLFLLIPLVHFFFTNNLLQLDCPRNEWKKLLLRINYFLHEDFLLLLFLYFLNFKSLFCPF